MEELFQLHRKLVTDYRRGNGGMDVDDDLVFAGQRGQWVGNETFLASAAVMKEGVTVVSVNSTHNFPSPGDVVASDWRMRYSGTHFDVDVAATLVPEYRPGWIPAISGSLHLLNTCVYHSNSMNYVHFVSSQIH